MLDLEWRRAKLRELAVDNPGHDLEWGVNAAVAIAREGLNEVERLREEAEQDAWKKVERFAARRAADDKQH